MLDGGMSRDREVKRNGTVEWRHRKRAPWAWEIRQIRRYLNVCSEERTDTNISE